MQKSVKTLISALIALFVMSSLTVIVAADRTVVKSGSGSGYTWTYYSDKALEVKATSGSLDFSSSVPSDVLTNATKIVVDTNALKKKNVSIYGTSCKASEVVISDNSASSYNSVNLYFWGNNLTKCSFAQSNAKSNKLVVSRSSMTTLNLALNFNVDTFQVMNCENLKNLTVSSTNGINILEIYENPNISSITLPSNLTRLNINNAPQVTQLTIPSTLKYCNLYDGDTGVGITSINIPSGCTMMIDCNNLKSATLASGRTKIDDEMFKSCIHLSSVNIPNTVTSIGTEAFYLTQDLDRITIPDSVKTIGTAAFAYSCISHISLPSSLKTINSETFYKCELLESIDIPESVTTIYADAFTGCNSLAQINYEGTAEQWNKIQIVSSANQTISQVFSHGKVTFGGFGINQQPKDYTGFIGETATFSVVADGATSYQWQYLNGSSWVNSSATGANTSKLSVGITQAREGQKYRCVATNSNGKTATSNAASIIINKTLSFTQQPSNARGVIGSYAKFTVVARGNDVKYQWQYYRDGEWHNSNSSGYDTPSMSIKITEARNGQNYRCRITDVFGESLYSFTVTIFAEEPSLEITSQPKTYTGAPNETAVFTVGATGDNITYQWQVYRDGGWKKSTATGYNTSSITVKITEARNGQKYRCIVKDMYGNKVTSSAATLKLDKSKAATITSQPSDFTGSIGAMANFTVSATGTGLTYKWYYYRDGDWKGSSSTGYNTNTLSIKVTEARDGQKYRCVIRDQYGNKVTSKTVALHVDKNGANITIVTNPSDFSGTVGTYAKFTVVVSGGSNLTYQWQFNNGSGWRDSSSTGYNTNTLTIKVTEARNGQQYRCVITSSDGSTITNVATIHVV
ncbi:MAG: leucine-rich repeat protein [Oscillospiraceae bacterium]|nr:leucine-rich repeat protein [Oscillospiraceae bacterium]